jgi:hypothetical protein
MMRDAIVVNSTLSLNTVHKKKSMLIGNCSDEYTPSI